MLLENIIKYTKIAQRGSALGRNKNLEKQLLTTHNDDNISSDQKKVSTFYLFEKKMLRYSMRFDGTYSSFGV